MMINDESEQEQCENQEMRNECKIASFRTLPGCPAGRRALCLACIYMYTFRRLTYTLFHVSEFRHMQYAIDSVSVYTQCICSYILYMSNFITGFTEAGRHGRNFEGSLT